MIVQPIQNCKLETLCYGDFFGTKITVVLKENQKWNAKKSGKYYTLTRKGTSVTLRMTETVLKNFFKEVTE